LPFRSAHIILLAPQISEVFGNLHLGSLRTSLQVTDQMGVAVPQGAATLRASPIAPALVLRRTYPGQQEKYSHNCNTIVSRLVQSIEILTGSSWSDEI
jgi:hypothetical protein